MSHSTSHRLFALNTPLGEDVLLIKEFQGYERLSRLFEFKLTLGSERDDIPADALVGKRVTLRIETVEGNRHWTGFVSRFTRLGPGMAEASHEEQLTFYHCEIVPWLWFMGLNEDSRIFQDKSIPDIVEEIFSDFLFSDYQLDLSGDHAQLPYCVQYRESNLNFISRLLERAGIYYCGIL